MVLGILYAVTFIISVGAIVQRNHVTIGLVILNWLLILDTIITVVFASVLWFRTLEELANNEKLWIAAPTQTRLTLQDRWNCCGYRNGTNIEIGGTVCPTFEVANATVGCMIQFSGESDYLLSQTFTCVHSTLGCGVLSLIIRQNYLGFHCHHHMPVHYNTLCHEEGTVFTPDRSAKL
jgi:hypothetical protein